MQTGTVKRAINGVILSFLCSLLVPVFPFGGAIEFLRTRMAELVQERKYNILID